jgi:hypothetical protein
MAALSGPYPKAPGLPGDIYWPRLVDLTRPQHRRRMTAISAKQSLRASASIAIRSLRSSVVALVKACFQAMNA